MLLIECFWIFRNFDDDIFKPESKNFGSTIFGNNWIL